MWKWTPRRHMLIRPLSLESLFEEENFVDPRENLFLQQAAQHSTAQQGVLSLCSLSLSACMQAAARSPRTDGTTELLGHFVVDSS